MSQWWLKWSVFLDLLGKLPNEKIKTFLLQFWHFKEERGGGSYSKDDKEPFFFGLNFLKENREGWQKPNTLSNFSHYKLV